MLICFDSFPMPDERKSKAAWYKAAIFELIDRFKNNGCMREYFLSSFLLFTEGKAWCWKYESEKRGC